MSRRREWTARVHGFPGRRPADLDEELAIHREMAQEHYPKLGHLPQASHVIPLRRALHVSPTVPLLQD